MAEGDAMTDQPVSLLGDQAVPPESSPNVERSNDDQNPEPHPGNLWLARNTCPLLIEMQPYAAAEVPPGWNVNDPRAIRPFAAALTWHEQFTRDDLLDTIRPLYTAYHELGQYILDQSEAAVPPPLEQVPAPAAPAPPSQPPVTAERQSLEFVPMSPLMDTVRSGVIRAWQAFLRNSPKEVNDELARAGRALAESHHRDLVEADYFFYLTYEWAKDETKRVRPQLPSKTFFAAYSNQSRYRHNERKRDYERRARVKKQRRTSRDPGPDLGDCMDTPVALEMMDISGVGVPVPSYAAPSRPRKKRRVQGEANVAAFHAQRVRDEEARAQRVYEEMATLPVISSSTSSSSTNANSSSSSRSRNSQPR